MSTRRIKFSELRKALRDALNGVDSSRAEAIRKIIKDLPRSARTEALAFYPKVLNAPTGHLRRGIKGFGRKSRGNVLLGLKVVPGAHPVSKTNRARYGRFHELGSPGGQISAKYFLSIPLRTAARESRREILKTIGFR